MELDNPNARFSGTQEVHSISIPATPVEISRPFFEDNSFALSLSDTRARCLHMLHDIAATGQHEFACTDSQELFKGL